MFALAEVRGQIGPCGCTSDPLGDISRTPSWSRTRARPGRCSWSTPAPCCTRRTRCRRTSTRRRSSRPTCSPTIYTKRARASPRSGSGRPTPRRGPSKVRFAARSSRTSTDELRDQAAARSSQVGDAKVGVFGVIAEDAFKVSRSAIRSRRARPRSQKLRGRGRAGRDRAGPGVDARKTRSRSCKAIGGIDLAIAGLGQNAPEPERDRHRADEARRRLARDPRQPRPDRQPDRRHDARRAARSSTRSARRAAKAKIAQLDKQLAARDAELARFAADKTADQAFVAAKQKERAAARRRSASSSQAQPLVVPATGSYFTLDQVKINKTLACSTPAQDVVTAFYARRRRGERQGRRGQGAPSPPRRARRATSAASRAATATTRRGRSSGRRPCTRTAWKTLVDRGQQFDYDCIGCHVTGWRQARRLEPRAQRQAARRPVRDLPRPGVDPRREGRRGEAARDHARAAREPVRDAVPHARALRHVPARRVPARHRRSRPRRRSAARSSVTARPGATCARPPSTKPVSPSARTARGEAACARLACARRVWRRRSRTREPSTNRHTRARRCTAARDVLRRVADDRVGRTLRQARADRGASNAAARYEGAGDERAQRRAAWSCGSTTAVRSATSRGSSICRRPPRERLDMIEAGVVPVTFEVLP